eukprot:4573922-Lingulodinium_polyedra.AAC.1
MRSQWQKLQRRDQLAACVCHHDDITVAPKSFGHGVSPGVVPGVPNQQSCGSMCSPLLPMCATARS